MIFSFESFKIQLLTCLINPPQTLSNALYQLAIHPEKQSILAEELRQALDGVEVDSAEYFDKVNNHIPYLEATIKETLRMCPPVTRLQRRVGVDGYKLGGQPLEKDTHVDLAVYAVHHSAEYYEDPDTFQPERFLPENKHKLVPYTYLPFGAGTFFYMIISSFSCYKLVLFFLKVLETGKLNLNLKMKKVFKSH